MAGFGAIYTPVVILVVVIFVAGRIEENVTSEEGVEITETATNTDWTAILVTSAVLAFVAMALAWWWAGRAVRPVAKAIDIQEQLIEEASHELRTPLSVLSTNAEVLLDHPEPTLDIYRAGLQRSQAAAARMTETIEALLVDARGRARTVDARPTDLTALVASVVDGLQPLAATDRVTVTAIDTKPVLAPIDRSSVERAISNLVTNAIRHSPPGSVVSTAVEQRDGHAAIVVADQGPGIAPELADQVFERYWRDGDPGDGSGIGLAIVRQVARAHGGDATVNSNGDESYGANPGTRFTVTLKT